MARLAALGIVSSLLAITLRSPLPAQSIRSTEPLLTKMVLEFQFHGKSRTRGHLAAEPPADLPEAALHLGIHSHVRICIEGAAKRPGPAITINAKNKTVGEILQLMTKQDPSYVYREHLSVVEVLPVGAANDATDCLNMVIPKFEVHYPWQIAWGQVRCQIAIISKDPNDIVSDPLRVGRCWGASVLPAPPDKILYASFDHAKVRDILDTLASKAGNVAWYLPWKTSAPNCTAFDRTIAEYAPKTMYRRLDTQAIAFTERPPIKCLKCHYHKTEYTKTGPWN